MSAIEIEARFNTAISGLMAVLEREDPERTTDVAGALQLLAQVKLRTAIAIASDLEGWLSWWQDGGQRLGGSSRQSIPEYLEALGRCKDSFRRTA